MSLLEDARNIQRKDPAARSVLEVILLYPGFHILVYHRIAHWLYEHGHFSLPAGSASTAATKPASRSTPVPDRQVPVHRPRHGHRVRRDHRDRRQLHHLPWRDTGRHRQGHRKAPPHPGQQCADRRGHQGAGPGVYRDNARIGAGSVVLRNLPANCTAVGVPAEVVRINNKAVNPADDLDQQDLPDVMAQRLTELDRRISRLEKDAQGDVPPSIHEVIQKQQR